MNPAESGQGNITHRIGGAHDANTTLTAPTSLAIWIISFDVVPRTIESVQDESDEW
jgi:hypothetical protein